MKPGCLAGIRVVDLTRVLAGPLATQTLADLGADVIKVERPGCGDDTRSWAPPYVASPDGGREGAYFVGANRGKRSLTLDLSTPQGQAVIRDLVGNSDVLVENYKPGALARYGLDYSALAAINPRLIYCSITGYGQSGPYKDRPGYDPIMQAMGGMIDLTGDPDGDGQRVGVAVTDIMTGLYGAIGVLAALRERERSGLGQQIDLALFDTQVAALASVAIAYLAGGPVPCRMGNAHPTVVPSGAFACRDGKLQLMAGNDKQFADLCHAMGCPEMAVDSRFRDVGARISHRQALNQCLAERLATRPRADWLAALTAADVPCGPVNNVADVFADPHVQARGLSLTLSRPGLPAIPSIANPLRFSRSAIDYERAPPALGEHTREILAELGYAGEQIACLRQDKVI